MYGILRLGGRIVTLQNAFNQKTQGYTIVSAVIAKGVLVRIYVKGSFRADFLLVDLSSWLEQPPERSFVPESIHKAEPSLAD